MKICLLGKYPPIEGGVSARNYWMARGLAERGHQVFVVTNASEVEDSFRMQLTDQDERLLEPRFEASGGCVRVVQTPGTTLKYRYIPWANPFVSRLASLACQTVREYGCDAIYSYYFEPYGVAAHLASRWTGVPYIVKHAGSDLGRLMDLPDLKTAYEEILKAANLVVTDPGHKEYFAGLGVSANRIFTGLVFSLPTEFFHPGAEPIDVARVLQSLAASARLAGRSTPACRTDAPDPSVPAVGIYGKVGDIKGSYDLLNALRLLRSDGLQFSLLAMTHGWEKREDLFRRAIEEQGLARDTWVLPFLAPWRVPNFIRRCTAVCFLERNFPIAGHAPVVPQEILACGTCLVVSLEIAQRPMYRDRVAHGINALIVRDPRNEQELAGHLRLVMTRPDRVRQLGAQGHKASKRTVPEAAFIDSVEAMFRQLLEAQPERKKGAATALARALTILRNQMPWTSLLLVDHLESLLRRFLGKRRRVIDQSETAQRFGSFLEELIASGALDVPYLPEVLRYELSCLVNSKEQSRADDYESVLFRAGTLEFDDGIGLPASLKPYLFSHIRIESFEYDIEQLIDYLSKGRVPPPLPKCKSVIVFQPAAGGRNFKVNSAAADLMPMLDGERSISAIHSDLASRYGLTSAEDGEGLLKQVQGFLRDLVETGIIGLKM